MTSRSNKTQSAAPKKKTTKSAAGSAGAGGPAVSASSPAPPDATSPAVLAMEPAWRLRIIASDSASLIVQKDTEKEDRYKMIKDSWESAREYY
jgi:hypothetical protein